MSEQPAKPPELSDKEIAECIKHGLKKEQENSQIRLLQRLDAVIWNSLVHTKWGEERWQSFRSKLKISNEPIQKARVLSKDELEKRKLSLSIPLELKIEKCKLESGLDLSGFVFERVQIDFSKVNICLKKSYIQKLFIYESVLRLDLEEAQIENSEISRCKYLRPASFANTHIKSLHFLGYQEGMLKFHNSKIEEISANDCEFSNLEILDSKVESLEFTKCNISEADFSNSHFRHILFSGTNFKKVDFFMCKFTKIADFKNTKFESPPGFHGVEAEMIFFDEKRGNFGNGKGIQELHHAKHSWQTSFY